MLSKKTIDPDAPILEIPEKELLFFGCRLNQKSDHEHIYKKGKFVMSIKDGGYIEETPENRQKYENQSDGSSVVCDICGRPAMEDMYWME